MLPQENTGCLELEGSSLDLEACQISQSTLEVVPPACLAARLAIQQLD